MTGIELAADSCVLVDVRRGPGAPQLVAVHVVEPIESAARSPRSLAKARRRKRFSPHAHVVAWTADEAALEPLRAAGFIIHSVLTPEQALAILAAERSRPSTGNATAWLALSRQGGALVIVRGAQILYSRRIAWRYQAATRLNEQLLQRYTLVSHIAPELRHGMDLVRAAHGVETDSAVTCGDLPDLRSLTMPLIEEMDLEVETLDSLDGLDVTPAAVDARAVEYAPALRLASAVTVLPPVHAPKRGWWGRAAAAFVVVAAAGWLVFAALRPGSNPLPRRDVATVAPTPAATSGGFDSEPAIVPLVPRAAAAGRQAPVPTTAGPLPSIGSILFGADRRVAIVNGRIVEEGDAVGGRRIVRIDRDSVLLRDPAGGEVRVGIRRLKQPRQP